MKEGWICPRCKTIHAPYIDKCDCSADLPIVEEIKIKPSVPPHLPYIWPNEMERYRIMPTPTPKPYYPSGIHQVWDLF